MDYRLQVYTDFVKPTCKVECFRVYTEDKPTQKKQLPKKNSLNLKVRVASQLTQKKYLKIEPFIPHSRIIDIKVKTQPRLKDEEKRVFDKNKSAFKNWEADNARTLAETACIDIQYWKVHKFCKDPVDQKKVRQIVMDNFGVLKHMYITLISTPDYPNVGQITLANWCQDANLIDKVLEQ